MSLAESGTTQVLPAERTIGADVAMRLQVSGANGIQITAYQFHDRQPGRPNLLFAHANGFNAGCYTPFLLRLARRFNIFAYDIRGHGASERPPSETVGNYLMELLGEDLAAVTAAVQSRIDGNSDLHFASPSVGGIGLFMWLGSTGLEPFQSATMFEPPLHPAQKDRPKVYQFGRGDMYSKWAAKRRIYFDSPEDFRAECSGYLTYQTISDEMMDALVCAAIKKREDGAGYELRCLGEVESRIYERCPSSPVFETATKLHLPMLMYYGDPSLTGGSNPLKTTIGKLADALPNGEARMMENQRHLMVLENPDKCAAAVFAHALGDS
jgi:pimeloyl-ACP methyl ester carboxylesterase